MCILLKFDYAKFGVSNLFFLERYQREAFGGSARPLDKGRVKMHEKPHKKRFEKFKTWSRDFSPSAFLFLEPISKVKVQ